VECWCKLRGLRLCVRLVEGGEEFGDKEEGVG
jgi:hypothetical protein